jgi:Copper chaperone
MEKLDLTVQGMSCGGCVSGVTKALEAVPGVSGVQVTLEGGKVSLSYDAHQAGPELVKAAIREAGFEVVG